jgi:peroxiredoxin
LEQAYPEFRNRNAALLALSTDSTVDALNMMGVVGASYAILADPDAQTARDYGVYDLLGDGVAAPAVFILSSDGNIHWKYVGEDAGDRPSTDQILTELDKL